MNRQRDKYKFVIFLVNPQRLSLCCINKSFIQFGWKKFISQKQFAMVKSIIVTKKPTAIIITDSFIKVIITKIVAITIFAVITMPAIASVRV